MKQVIGLILWTILIVTCTPSTIDTLKQDPASVARWLQAGERIYRATGISWEPQRGPCEGPGCAYTVDATKGEDRLGEAFPDEFRATVLRGLDEDTDGQVKLHELLHTMLVMHVTSESVMHPHSARGRDCISEAELWQLCHIFQGRCSRQVPECEIGKGWKVIVPGTEGPDQVEIDPVLWEKRIRAGRTFVELFLELTRDDAQ